MQSFTFDLVKSCISCILNSKNFKVRIAAANALGQFSSLESFGATSTEQVSKVEEIIQVLDTALQSRFDLVEASFGEYKYQEQLKEQLETTQAKFKDMVSGNR
jgi:hypothetical protein